jgi:hypothetical protein
MQPRRGREPEEHKFDTISNGRSRAQTPAGSGVGAGRMDVTTL